MAVEFNHHIVHAKDRDISAKFWCEILGLPSATPFGPFLVVKFANGASLDIIGTDDKFDVQHYAFKVSEKEFDQIFARLKSRGSSYWADPARTKPGQIYTHNGGRGVYFTDPSGHFLEILTWI